MDQRHPERALHKGGRTFSAFNHVAAHSSTAIAMPSNTSVLPEPAFGPSHSHRIWRMMNALIDAVPEWADAGAFEQARETMLRLGLSNGMSLEELYALTDPDVILDLWTAAQANDAAD